PPFDEPPAGRGSTATAERKPRRTGRTIGVVVVVVLVLLVLAAAWLAFRALTVKSELEQSRAIIGQVQHDERDLRDALGDLGDHAAAAASAAGDPVWRVAEIVPVAGDNLRGARLAAESLDVAVNDLGVPALGAFGGDGEGSAFSRVLPVLDSAAPEVVRLAGELADVQKSTALIGPVRDGVDQVAEVMGGAAPLIELLPEMLGANGPRNYLLVFQNNAETVGLGGSAASQSLVRADGGSIDIVRQADSGRYANDTPVDVEVPQSALDLYSDFLVKRINTSSSRPDFPTMARIVTEWWQRDIADDQIDGVLSVDPIGLARMLRATGPIQLATGDELTEDNAVDLLLNEAYVRWGPQETKHFADAFFASAAVSIFDKLAGGDFDLKDMAWAVGEGIDRGNIMFYSPHEDVQQVVEPLRLSGILPEDNVDATTIGVYFRDESASKIDYYMDSAIDVAERCTDGRRTFTTETTLHLDIDQAAADVLPEYVRSQTWGSSQFRTQVYVYGPPGTTVDSVSVDGRDVTLMRDDVQDLGRPVAWFQTYLAPTERATVTATFAAEDGEFGEVELRSTPMINKTDVELTSEGCGR
ncbi:DUF4012 domain-containing protein, partial [Microbacterium paludicola]